MDVVIWVAVYLVLIAALATWREHHDARAKRHRRTGERHDVSPTGRRLDVPSPRGAWTHSHRTS